jgi:hypothetical protein
MKDKALQLTSHLNQRNCRFLPRRVWRFSRRAKERTTPSSKRTADKSLITNLLSIPQFCDICRACWASRYLPAGLALPSVATSGQLWRISHYRRSASTNKISQRPVLIVFSWEISTLTARRCCPKFIAKFKKRSRKNENNYRLIEGAPCFSDSTRLARRGRNAPCICSDSIAVRLQQA